MQEARDRWIEDTNSATRVTIKKMVLMEEATGLIEYINWAMLPISFLSSDRQALKFPRRDQFMPIFNDQNNGLSTEDPKKTQKGVTD
jgi:hypothetical protein